MPESQCHIGLVEALARYVAGEYFAGEYGALLIDSPKSLTAAKPQRIEGYTPDVIGVGFKRGAVVLGEAKTAQDLDNRHTREQVAAFLGYCAKRPGSVFVFAVPWHMTRFANALLKSVASNAGCESVSCVVLERLEG